MKFSRENIVRWLKVPAFLLCLGPACVLTWKTFHDLLGANPVDVITRSTGKWTLTFLLITLGVTPVRRIIGFPWLIRFRRMLGLYAFFYGTLHFMTYVWLDQFFMVEEMIADVVARPFITVGFMSFVLLIPLAVTSTTKMIKRLGGKWWQRLHRTLVFISMVVVLHFLCLVKAFVQSSLTFCWLLPLPLC